MKVIITGSRGFIGKNLINKFPKNYKIYKLYFKSLTKLNSREFKKKIKQKISNIKPDVVIHAATHFKKSKDNLTKKICFKVNFEYSKIFINTIIENKVKKIIFFGKNHEFEIDKRKFYPYLSSKKKFSSFLKKVKNNKSKILVIYLFNTFGENDKRNKIYSQIINGGKKLTFYKNLKFNFINVDSLSNFILKKISLRWNFNKKFVSLLNKNFFELSELGNLRVLFFTNKITKNLILENKIKIPVIKNYTSPNKKNSIYEFIKKKLKK